MKKSRLFILIFILSAIFQTTCYAFNPYPYLCCEISEDSIPENAEYTDLLLPIKNDDENYVDFNTLNGQKYDITKDSEIAKYHEQGYISYTFHYKNAVCDIKPYFIVNFSCEDGFCKQNSELLKTFDEYKIDIPPKYHYSIKAYLNSDTAKDVNALKQILNNNTTFEKNGAEVRFDAGSMEDDTFFDNRDSFEKMRKYCKTAKMVYIDKDGNIISVSNKVQISDFKEWFRGDPVIHLHLDGNTFSSSFSFGPPFFLLFFGFSLLIILLIISIFVAIIIAFVHSKK